MLFLSLTLLQNLIFFLQEMTPEEKGIITSLSKCDFTHMSQYFKAQSEARKQMTKDEKQVSRLRIYLYTHVPLCAHITLRTIQITI